jgi:hypothetical protein
MHSPIILYPPITLKKTCRDVMPSTRIMNLTATSSTTNEKRKRSRRTSWSAKNDTKKKVSFSETCRIKHVLHLDDYTDEEEEACWYSPEECDEISRKCAVLITRIVQGTTTMKKTQTKYCVRGLERMPPKATEERKLRRLDAYIAVLKEQNKIFFKACNKIEAIARKYSQAAATEKCQEAACAIGREDALIAMKIQKT